MKVSGRFVLWQLYRFNILLFTFYFYFALLYYILSLCAFEAVLFCLLLRLRYHVFQRFPPSQIGPFHDALGRLFGWFDRLTIQNYNVLICFTTQTFCVCMLGSILKSDRFWIDSGKHSIGSFESVATYYSKWKKIT